MRIQVTEDPPISLGYMNLEDCQKSWGDKGRSIYDGLIRQTMNFHGVSNKDIHSPRKIENKIGINEQTNIQDMSNLGDVS